MIPRWALNKWKTIPSFMVRQVTGGFIMMKIKRCSGSLLWSGPWSIRPMKTGGHFFRHIQSVIVSPLKMDMAAAIDLFRHQDYLTETVQLVG